MVSIRDILRNRVYLGTYSRFGVKVPGSHTPLVSADDFRLVQDRLSARRTSHSPRVASQYLLSGMAYCGYCGNKLIGVSRKQAWKRATGERMSNSYRYYQCESRTNQSVCSYHTRRADDLEAQVRQLLSEMFASGNGFPQAGDEAAVLAEQAQERDRLRSRQRSIDRRLEGYVDSAAKGRLSKDKMHKLSVAAAADRLAVEDALEAVDRRISEYVDAAGRKRGRERDVAKLLDAWDELTFVERHAGLREAIGRVTVTDDDAVKIILRP
jgi:site-specific DNA recombinase